MKKIILCMLVFILLTWSMVYAASTILDYLAARSRYEISYRETCFRHDDKETFYRYELDCVEYKDKLLTEYGY